MSRNANELQENSNASSKEEYILQILPALLIINKTGNINLHNIFLFKRSIWVFLELICRWTRQLLKTYNWTNYFIFGTPWPPDLLCKHWLTFSVRNFCLWVTDIPPREMSQATRSEETRLFLLDMFCTEGNSTQNEAHPFEIWVKRLVSIGSKRILQFFLHSAYAPH